jgi:peptidoglycan/LPS O-acetylase OafA/YrhL
LTGNGPVWSLNYEIVYYALFILLWVTRPQSGMVLLVTLLFAFAALVAPSGVISLSSYATGYLFWLLGLAAAWWLSPAQTGFASLPALLCFLATDRFQILRVLFDQKLGFPLPFNQVNLADLILLPVCLLLLCEASGRRFPGYRAFRAAVLVVPVSCLAFQVFTGGAFRSVSLLPAELMTCAMLLALLRPRSTTIERTLCFAGAISYALYLLHRPIMWFVLDSAWLPSGSISSYLLRATVVLALLFPIAWWAEQWLQPRVKARLVKSTKPWPQSA